ncbi:hypothetical protein [Sphingomonas sp. SRS2]|uniref:hypothetical protein n=1 Tax=Sphingomonas sp. SRS2 TaxID=133190 RepID=UPI000A475DAA|nr:hypothetical protein [Sphingomonas sp. SRS2]
MASIWGKGVILLLALILAAGSLMDALASNWRLTRPNDALRLRPNDAFAIAFAEDIRISGGTLTPQIAAAMAERARTALRSEPLTPAALRQVGTAEAMANRPAQALRLFKLAHRVSRRELGTLVWLIDYSVSQGDGAAALARFDEALSTNELAADLLFAPLASAMFDPQLRTGLAVYLTAERPWMPDFLRYLLDDDEGRKYVSVMVRDAGGLPQTSDYDGIDGAILTSLARDKDFAAARAYLLSVPGGPALLRESGVTATTAGDQYGPFGWRLSTQPGLEAYVRDERGLSVRVGRDRQGSVARRFMLLPAGAYRLDRRFEAMTGAAAAETRWEISCIGAKGGSIWSDVVPGEAEPRALRTRFVIPAGCAAQEFVLTAGGGRSEVDAETEISDIVVQADGRSVLDAPRPPEVSNAEGRE